MKNNGCEFGTYNKLTYRICYGLTEEGKMNYSIPLYEFTKYCNCEICNKRLKYDRKPSNGITIVTDDKNKFEEIKNLIDNYTCNSNYYDGIKHIGMKNGKIEERTLP